MKEDSSTKVQKSINSRTGIITKYSIEEYGKIQSIPKSKIESYKVWYKKDLSQKSIPEWDIEFKKFSNREIN